MKFFHLSDLHIGIKLMNRDLSEDQEYIFRQIADYAAAEKPAAVVIAGDVYDRAVPSGEAVMLFDRFVGMLREAAPEAEIMVISGNHDSGPRINVFRNVLAGQRVRMIGLPPLAPEERVEKVTLEDEFGKVNFYLLPFVRPSMVRRALTGEEEKEPGATESAAAGDAAEEAPAEIPAPEAAAADDALPEAPSSETAGDGAGPDEDGTPAAADDGPVPLSYDETLRRLLAREDIDLAQRNVLVSHQFYLPAGTAAEDVERADSEVRTVGNIDEVGTDVLAPFDYAALGHIHKPMKAGSEVYRYCGSPLFTSVSEAGQQKGIVVVELGEKKAPASAPAGLPAGENMTRTDDGSPENMTREDDGSPENMTREGASGPENTAGAVKIRVLPLTPMREVRVVRGPLEDVVREASEDYVTVVLTDEEDLDVPDMQDRLHKAFPRLLEIRRENLRAADYGADLGILPELASGGGTPDLFAMVNAFLPDLDEEEKALLKDVINSCE